MLRRDSIGQRQRSNCNCTYRDTFSEGMVFAVHRHAQKDGADKETASS